jgi:hypothetical protein
MVWRLLALTSRQDRNSDSCGHTLPERAAPSYAERTEFSFRLTTGVKELLTLNQRVQGSNPCTPPAQSGKWEIIRTQAPCEMRSWVASP